MALVLDDCCGFITLRHGCFIIGYLNLGGTLYLICKSIIGIIKADSLMHKNLSDPYNVAWIVGKAALIMHSVLLVAGLLELLFTVLLLIGLHQRRRGFIKAHFIFNFIFLIIYLVGVILYMSSGDVSFLMVIFDLFTMSLTLYLLLVIRSYYIKMGKEAEHDNQSTVS